MDCHVLAQEYDSLYSITLERKEYRICCALMDTVFTLRMYKVTPKGKKHIAKEYLTF